MNNKVNLSNPIYATRWLRQLVGSNRFGLSFRINAFTPEKYLRFSNKSNQFGLKGPCNVNSETVVCGTSFGLGVGVNQGKNWYDLLPKFKGYFNISFPVSTRNHLNRLDELYKGSYENLIYIYHPNLWVTSKGFYEAEKVGLDIFSYNKWKTTNISLYGLIPRFWLKKTIRYLKGFDSYEKISKNYYHFNNTYSYINLNDHNGFTSEEVGQLNELFKRFENVYMIRVPIKEELMESCRSNAFRRKATDNYNDNWKFMKKKFPNVSYSNFNSDFDFDDFLPFDTHWSEKGNQTFSLLLNKII